MTAETVNLRVPEKSSEIWYASVTSRYTGMTDFDRTLTSFYTQDELAEVPRKTAKAQPMQQHGLRYKLHFKMQLCNLY